MACFTETLDGVQLWQLPFHMVTGIQIADDKKFLEVWEKVAKEGAAKEMEVTAAGDIKEYVDNYAESHILRLENPLSSLIDRVTLRAIGDREHPELVFHVVPKEGLTDEQTENLGNALFPLSLA